ncbi:TBC1 domain family member 19 [Brachionus plicatilis]|uniref:TBC1 domain family member 19 n=1 Tax=Brachionus plicatilis TaxID=10195 RepID=A0A3M7QIQ2_BRAPC|nr:TBC1 domain family member 19 [Brachionus plicatilis]
MDQGSKYNSEMDVSQSVFNTQAYYEFLKNVQELASNSPNISLINMNEVLMEKIKNSTSSRKITNLIYTNLEFNSIIEKNDFSGSYLTKAQTQWEKKLIKNFNLICTELNMPLAKKRSIVEGQELKRIWNELGTNVSDMKKFRPIFSTSELLEQILSLKCNNLSDLAVNSMTGLINVPISIKSLKDLKKQYERMSLDFFQSGLDENLNSVIEQEKHKNGVKVVEINDVILSKEFSKTGCTRSLRSKLWSQILNVNVGNLDIIYYNYLKQCVFEYDFLIDSIYYKDVKIKAVNDDQLFVFEDLLYQVLLMFARDTHVLKCYEEKSIQSPKGFIKLKNSTDLKHHPVIYPPNGFIPFDGFSMLVAPICYVFADPVLLYFIFRKFFVNHFYKLSIISSDPQSIVGLCALFENVLQSKDPKLFIQLRKMDIQPIKIAFKWIIRAFSGYLQSSQLLELWDRMLAFNSLEILPIFAAGIFLYRRQSLMSVPNKLHVESILDDLKSVRVVAILQLVFA